MKNVPYGFNFHREKVFFTQSIKEFAEIIFNLGCKAIELSYLRVDVNREEIIEAKNILNKFDFISIHSSLNGLLLRESLKQIDTIKDLINIQSVVFHPDKIDDWKLLRKFTNPSLENMDYKHNKFIHLDEMERLADENNCMIVVDLAHLYSVENDINKWIITSNLASKISHFHMSNVVSGESGSRLHGNIVKENKNIIEFAMQYQKPIIIEALPKTLEGLKDSIEIMKDILK